MADQAQSNEAPKKTKRKPQGPRQERPVFAVFRYTDESGQPVKLDESRLKVEFTKDAAELVKMITGANADPHATVLQVQINAAKRESPASAGEAA